MIRHIVMWKIADTENKEERARAIKENLEALTDKIDAIVSLEVGININKTPYAADVVLVSDFNTSDDLAKYADDPRHKAVGAAYVGPYVTERRVVDYEY